MVESTYERARGLSSANRGNDWTWRGFNWLRPAKNHHVGYGYILLSSILLGLPGVGVGTGLIYWYLGRVEARVWLAMFALVMPVELPLHLLFAHFWNRRADVVVREAKPT